ncbi:MAG TPA: TetR/AcrR family transcriptional regulator [Burkholderiaceae bacterium]
MNTKSGLRPGGRSARVQAAVHQAVKDLGESRGRDNLTVPLIAAQAGVTPSTIYRRWGDLADLLADVAKEELRPDSEPEDTGSIESDLRKWAEQYLDEMSSEVGLTMMRDVIAGSASGDNPVPCQCAAFTQSQIQIIIDRGIARGEAVPQAEAVMDGVVAPIIYRTLFGPAPMTLQGLHALLETCMKGATRPRKKSAVRG